jgi:C1A family cysteine protease
MGNYYSTEPTSTPGRKYGWKRDLPDLRDHMMAFEGLAETTRVDLRDRCPPVYDQSQLGSCTANAIAAAYQFDEIKQCSAKPFMPSRLFIYYNERDMEGTISVDSGASIRNGIKSVNRLGVCHETLWPYDIAKFAVRPTQECYQDSKQHKSLRYHRIKQNSQQLKSALNSGYPVVFGITVYESFESEEVAKTGVVPMPTGDEKLLGGHALLLVGYDNESRQWLFRNSWGEEWGDKGYGYLPFKYLAPKNNLAGDFWIIETVEQLQPIED